MRQCLSRLLTLSYEQMLKAALVLATSTNGQWPQALVIFVAVDLDRSCALCWREPCFSPVSVGGFEPNLWVHASSTTNVAR